MLESGGGVEWRVVASRRLYIPRGYHHSLSPLFTFPLHLPPAYPVAGNMREAFMNLSTFLWALGGTQFIFLMTALGAATVFFLRDFEPRFQAVLPGFAGGVMTAASFWSLLLPAIEQARAEGRVPAWLPAAAGIVLGALFLLAAEDLQKGAREEGLLFTAITLTTSRRAWRRRAWPPPLPRAGGRRPCPRGSWAASRGTPAPWAWRTWRCAWRRSP